VRLELLEELKVPGERVYLNFAEIVGTSWGNNGRTLGNWVPEPKPGTP
jgi:hypothetical protein